MNLYLCRTHKRDDVKGNIAFGAVRAETEKDAARLFMIALREERHEEDVPYIYIQVHLVTEVDPNVAASLKMKLAEAPSFHREAL